MRERACIRGQSRWYGCSSRTRSRARAQRRVARWRNSHGHQAVCARHLVAFALVLIFGVELPLLTTVGLHILRKSRFVLHYAMIHDGLISNCVGTIERIVIVFVVVVMLLVMVVVVVELMMMMMMMMEVVVVTKGRQTFTSTILVAKVTAERQLLEWLNGCSAVVCREPIARRAGR